MGHGRRPVLPIHTEGIRLRTSAGKRIGCERVRHTDRVQPVSYTHLDVYKRQMLNSQLKQVEGKIVYKKIEEDAKMKEIEFKNRCV